MSNDEGVRRHGQLNMVASEYDSIEQQGSAESKSGVRHTPKTSDEGVAARCEKYRACVWLAKGFCGMFLRHALSDRLSPRAPPFV